MEEILAAVLHDFGFSASAVSCVPFGNGLINSTFKVSAPGGEYILQRINTNIFKQPEFIAQNIQALGDYLQELHPDYLFIRPLATTFGRRTAEQDGGIYRMFPFVPNSHTVSTVKTAEQAYQAAAQFGKFTSLLEGFTIQQLRMTLPGFHDIGQRYSQFAAALLNGNKQRIEQAAQLIQTLQQYKYIVGQYEALQHNPGFKLRVTHHDTKISNVLFDGNDKGICVIDLDTVMPGYFISDVGDMMRTYLCAVSEEEKDTSLIEVRKDFYDAVGEGYMSQMGDELSGVEKQHFTFAGMFIIYMQALRFLTDHLNDDVYYGSKYEGQNLVRAKNQAVLLERLREFWKKR